MAFGSAAIEVAIGMIFVYLLLSMLCSALGEYIEAKTNTRARFLREGIALLLNETNGGGIDLAQQLYNHGLIRPLYREAAKLPSYIPSRTFALALWNMATSAVAGEKSGSPPTASSAAGVLNDLKRIREVVAAQVPNPELRTAILTLIDEADGDMARARKNIEDWYDAMMDRVSGWYKRRTAVVMLVLGFVLAAVVNVDTISLANALVRDGALRSSLIAAAQQRLTTPLPAAPGANLTPELRASAAADSLQQARAAVGSLGFPIGWVAPTTDNTGDSRRMPTDAAGWLLKALGILLTGFAISQGSPFWFDLLNKFMVVRSTVKPSEKSREQPSKDKPAPESETEKKSE
jgi:hypothetical protein